MSVPQEFYVGDGVTLLGYSDRRAYTVIKVTPQTMLIQRDKAELDPTWKPKFVAGGFAGHCINNGEQRWNYERDPNGEVLRVRKRKDGLYWSHGQNLFAGRSEFYDYNF